MRRGRGSRKAEREGLQDLNGGSRLQLSRAEAGGALLLDPCSSRGQNRLPAIPAFLVPSVMKTAGLSRDRWHLVSSQCLLRESLLTSQSILPLHREKEAFLLAHHALGQVSPRHWDMKLFCICWVSLPTSKAIWAHKLSPRLFKMTGSLSRHS